MCDPHNACTCHTRGVRVRLTQYDERTGESWVEGHPACRLHSTADAREIAEWEGQRAADLADAAAKSAKRRAEQQAAREDRTGMAEVKRKPARRRRKQSADAGPQTALFGGM